MKTIVKRVLVSAGTAAAMYLGKNILQRVRGRGGGRRR